MKFSDVISRVRGIAGDTDALQFTDQQLVDWINDGMRECVTDNQLLQKTGTVNTVIGQTDYPMPTDILKLYSLKYDNHKLEVVTMEEFDNRWDTDGTEKGTPEVAVLWAGSIRLFPAPDSIKILKIDYSYSPTEALVGSLNTEVPLPALYHRRLVDYCLAIVYEQDDDQERSAAKMQEFKTGVQNLKDHAESTHDLYPHISVGANDMDGYPYYD